MLDDEEWWPDAPTPRALLLSRHLVRTKQRWDCRREVVPEVAASIIAVQVGEGVERVALIGDDVTTLLGTGDAPVGEAVLTGCLVWDRTLWMTYRTPPTGSTWVLNLAGYVVQQVTRRVTYTQDGSDPSRTGRSGPRTPCEQVRTSRPGHPSRRRARPSRWRRHRVQQDSTDCRIYRSHGDEERLP